MKMSAFTYALVLSLISVGLIPSGRSSAEPTVIENRYGTTIASTKKPGSLVKTLLTQSGTPFSSKEGRFRITLPPAFPTFQHKQQTQTTAVGNIELHTYISEMPQGGCFLAYSDFPPASFEGRSAQKILEDGRDGAFKNMNATWDKQENLIVQGHPAISVYGTGRGSTDQAKQFYIRAVFVLVQPRAYQIAYLAYDRAGPDEPQIQAYFKSFRLED